MLEQDSRYTVLDDAVFDAPDGRRIAYKRRRFLPQGETIPLLAEVTVAPGDRLDVITYRHLGDPEQFWQICDANNCLNPFDLTGEVGTSVRVPIPQFEEPR